MSCPNYRSVSQWSVKATLVLLLLWMPSTQRTQTFWWPPHHLTPQSDCGYVMRTNKVKKKKTRILTKKAVLVTIRPLVAGKRVCIVNKIRYDG